MSSIALPRPSFKVILVGPSGVGKTSLVSCFVKHEFETETISTVAPAFSTSAVKLADDTLADLQIWDTAGQETYLAISRMFYRDSQVAIVCYTSDAPETIGEWIARVREQVSDCVIILAATKADELSEDGRLELFNDGLQRTAQHGANSHYVTSAKTGLGVNDVFFGAATAACTGRQLKRPSVLSAPDAAADRLNRCC
jgi:small GTP-binding protein